MNGPDPVNAENLAAGYNGEEIIRSVSCSFEKGTFTGIIGPNGSGKTTLLRAISRILPATGILELDGRPVCDYTTAELGMVLGFVPQDEERSFAYTVMQVVLMSRYSRTGRFSPLSPDDYARCNDALERTGIGRLKDRSIRALSGGEWQRVLIARALAQDTPVILMDEPTSHLDLAHQAGILSLVRDLAGSGRTIIGVFHDLNLASQYCDRLLMIRDGKIVADGSPAKVLTPENVWDVYGAEVVTTSHPATGRTILLPLGTRHADSHTKDNQNVLVISGGGSGGELLRFLYRRGYSVSAGILATTDSDYTVAKVLKIPYIPVMPFSQISDHALEKLKRMIAQSDRIVLSAHPVGTGNLPVLEAVRGTGPGRLLIHLPEGRDIASYDFAKGAAAAVYQQILDAGSPCCETHDSILRHLEQESQRKNREGDP
ncbi:MULTISPECIES: ABC transporter ATP-binding protein [unclassified Methanoregula]|uniref:ABC transporter ATP-binding protein n=1 Tax=unclassified Methanoregula TaxID=2649730 RepID=UPI0009D0019B|nr:MULTISPECIES: ABC transporter ATP-binding protein [unclassified Methanoregula]OPX64397.1 MAG: Cobalamin import ATP-binding protein BtuD [Methanoregula sp. PtaB.Bin085]OPY34933.1 MAG: Cobalamin import ATP-binding protein BtuD [Methanoregula sp. PtaU1.Bin006]